MTIIRAFINSNVWIGLGAMGMLCVADLLHNPCPSSWHLYSIVFFAIILTYNWQRLLSVKKRQQLGILGNSGWFSGNTWFVYAMSIMASAICLFNFWWLSLSQQVALVMLGGVSVVYALPIIPSKNGFIRLRDFGKIKPFVLGITWGLVVSWLPLIAPVNSFSALFSNTAADWGYIAAMCLIFSAICIPFDVKDMDFDSATMAYPTLPVAYGINTTRWVTIVVACMGYGLLLGWLWMMGWGWPLLASTVMAFGTTLAVVSRFSETSGFWYYGVFLDGLLMAHSLLLLLGYWVEMAI